MSDVTEQVTGYIVAALPLDHRDVSTWSLQVEWCGGDRWAVRRGPFVYSRSSARQAIPACVFEPRPSARTDWFLRTYRFPLDEALAIARRIAPKIKVNGLTAADILAMDEQREKEKTCA